jgi:hypothetical protein
MTGKSIDDMDCEIEIGGGRAGADHAVVGDDPFVERQLYRGIALLELHAEGRIGGDAATVQKAGLGEQERTGAGRGEQGGSFRK